VFKNNKIILGKVYNHSKGIIWEGIYDKEGNLTSDSRVNMHQASAPAIAPALEAKQGEIP